jgi:predicted O-methyltransferase YrrM
MRSLLHKTTETFKRAGARQTVLKVAAYLRFLVNISVATMRMRLESHRRSGIEQSLDFAFDFGVGSVSIAPAQIRSEFAALLGILATDPPMRVLEVGTAKGGTLFLLSRVARDDASLASIDLPEGDFGGGYSREQIPLLRALSCAGQRLKLIRSDSHELGTVEEARSWFGYAPLDFVFIDGDHTYEGVRHDFLAYGALVRPNGLIAIHDIVPGRSDRVGGVPEFWQEIRPHYKTHELVEDWNQGGFGIGVVRVTQTGFDPPRFNR